MAMMGERMEEGGGSSHSPSPAPSLVSAGSSNSCPPHPSPASAAHVAALQVGIFARSYQSINLLTARVEKLRNLSKLKL